MIHSASITMLLLALNGQVLEKPQDENGAWTGLVNAVQTHDYPSRGRLQRQPRPDYKEQLAKLDLLLKTAAGTTAEPMVHFYRGNCLFFQGLPKEALNAFNALKTRFPDHRLCRGSGEGENAVKSMVGDAIADCISEMDVRSRYDVLELPDAVAREGVRVVFHTIHGDFEMEVYESASPQTVANFKKLIKSGFYNDTYPHNVASLRWIELGCPHTHKDNRPRTDDGNGSPGYDLPLELNSATHIAGACSMIAMDGKNRVHGSQFRICVTPQPTFDNTAPIFGKITKGLDVVKRISQERADDQNNPYEHIWIRGVEWVEND